MPAGNDLTEASYEMRSTVMLIEKLPVYTFIIGTIITAIGILAPDFR